jgi:hypothetical protein
MPKALLSREQWGQVHATAVALQSITEAARAHGVSPAAALKRAQREGWLVGHASTVEANRAARVERAKAAGAIIVSAPAQDAHRPAADVIDGEIVQNGRKTRAMLSQALCHAAGQARKTRHPLAKARAIRDVASAAATVHPDQFGSAAGASGGRQQDPAIAIQQAIIAVFGVGPKEWGYGTPNDKSAPQLEDTGEPPEPPRLAEGKDEQP